MENKKGELSVTMIIVIVIGLVVLAVAIYMVMTNNQAFNDTTACSREGGFCKDQNTQGVCGSQISLTYDPCAKQAGKVCCAIGS